MTVPSRPSRSVGSILLRTLKVLLALLLLAPVLLVGGIWLAVAASPTTTEKGLAGQRDAVVEAALRVEAARPGGTGPDKERLVARSVDEVPGVRVLGTSSPDASLVEVDVSIWAGPGTSSGFDLHPGTTSRSCLRVLTGQRGVRTEPLSCPPGTGLDPYLAGYPAPADLPEVALDPVARQLPSPGPPPCLSGSGTCLGG